MFEPFLDKLIPYIVHKHVLTPSVLSKIITESTKTLFPESNNGYPGPPPVVPTPEEQVDLRQNVELRLKELIPSIIQTPDMVSRILDPLSSPECNTHLIMLLYDLVIITLYPEIGLGGSRKVRESAFGLGGLQLSFGDDMDDSRVQE
ncbi:hypothetical protein FRC02_000484 [Tulasnella sp. 418]|nr:hypothetical protein FRC02_000484 [Tulasnella sp. 418]